jgi:hypothetical protein
MPKYHTLWRRSMWVALLVVMVAMSLIIPHFRKPAELDVYVRAAERMARGETIYRSADRKAFTYPPFFALPFLPLTRCPEAWRRPVWMFCNLCLACMVVGIVTTLTLPAARRGLEAGGPPIWINTVLVGVLSCKFLLMPLAWESHDLIIVLLMLLSCWCLSQHRMIAVGFFGGLAAACKATPLLLLPYLLWQRRITAASVMAATIVFVTLLPDTVFPQADGARWVESWHTQFLGKVRMGAAPAAEGAWTKWNELNQSLSGTIYRLATEVPPSRGVPNVAICSLSEDQTRLLTLSFDFLVVVFLAWAAWPRRLTVPLGPIVALESLGQFGAVLCAMLLLSPMSSTYHFCALLVPISFCATYWMYCERSRVVGAILVLQFMISVFSAQDIVGEWLADRALACGIITFDATMLLFGCGFILARQLPRHSVDELLVGPTLLPFSTLSGIWTGERRSKAA